MLLDASRCFSMLPTLERQATPGIPLDSADTDPARRVVGSFGSVLTERHDRRRASSRISSRIIEDLIEDPIEDHRGSILDARWFKILDARSSIQYPMLDPILDARCSTLWRVF
jgi:hypothetical protein